MIIDFFQKWPGVALYIITALGWIILKLYNKYTATEEKIRELNIENLAKSILKLEAAVDKLSTEFNQTIDKLSTRFDTSLQLFVTDIDDGISDLNARVHDTEHAITTLVTRYEVHHGQSIPIKQIRSRIKDS